MTVKCPNCGADADIGVASRDDCFCGKCEHSLSDRTAEIEHNKKEIEKLKWHSNNKPSDL